MPRRIRGKTFCSVCAWECRWLLQSMPSRLPMHGDNALWPHSVHHSYQRFQNGVQSVDDLPRSGRPSVLVNWEHAEQNPSCSACQSTHFNDRTGKTSGCGPWHGTQGSHQNPAHEEVTCSMDTPCTVCPTTGPSAASLQANSAQFLSRSTAASEAGVWR